MLRIINQEMEVGSQPALKNPRERYFLLFPPLQLFSSSYISDEGIHGTLQQFHEKGFLVFFYNSLLTE